jgi:diacylglycerol kinase (ATP)
MNEKLNRKLVFIINPRSGIKGINWEEEIKNFFLDRSEIVVSLLLPKGCTMASIKEFITAAEPDRVIAVGGDGTVKLVAECILETDIPLGILPAGSANGMAKELGIPLTPFQSLELVVNGIVKKIHLVRVNNELCIHLSDIGFNAFVVRYFETHTGRGWWGYLKASWRALWRHPHLHVAIKIDEQVVKRTASMIVIANATQYGTGAKINPMGTLDDRLFEVIVIKKISILEIYKMKFSHAPFNPSKTELFQTSELKILSKRKAHFQVDGEYRGRINEIKASIVPDALEVIVPYL